MNKHTPGPWTIDQWNTIQNSEGNTVRVEGVALSSKSTEESLANTHLIAAAPDLLEALSAIQSMIDQEPTDFALIDEIIFTAIAKATGESK